MFEQVVESLRKATEASVRVQQDLVTKWTNLWPGVPTAMPLWGEQVLRFQQFQREAAQTVNEVLKRQREVIEASFKMALENLEKVVQLTEVKTVEEMRTRTIELWQKCFDGLRQTCEVPLREFQAATGKWLEVVTKVAA